MTNSITSFKTYHVFLSVHMRTIYKVLASQCDPPDDLVPYITQAKMVLQQS